MRLSILIPAYREEANIHDILVRVDGVDLSSLGLDKEIVVCDDGSPDRTADLVAAFEPQASTLRLVRHARNHNLVLVDGHGAPTPTTIGGLNADAFFDDFRGFLQDPLPFLLKNLELFSVGSRGRLGPAGDGEPEKPHHRIVHQENPRDILFFLVKGDRHGDRPPELLFGA